MNHIRKHSAFYTLCIVVLVCLLLNSCGQNASRKDNTETFVVKTSASAASLASPTPVVPLAGPAVLGGQIGAFVHKFGDPNNDSDPSFDSYSFKRYSASKTDYLRVVGDQGDGQQWMPYVYLIVVDAPPQQSWDSSTADALCTSFLPNDARYVSQSLDVSATGAMQGINILYFSAALKQTLPASQFNDAQHNPVQSGLLDIFYSFARGNHNAIDSCTLVPGTTLGS